jgi:glutamate-1-semialdehyde aminotransferase
VGAACVPAQLSLGLGYGASHPLEPALAEAVCRTVPSAELCVFSSTGSEAVHAALRIARAAALLLQEGVHVIPRGLLYVSTAHSDADMTEAEGAITRAMAHARAETA